jgi:hypothetical protein
MIMFCLNKKIQFVSLLMLALASIKGLSTMNDKERATLNIIILKSLRGALDSNMTPAQIKTKLVMALVINEIMKFRKQNPKIFGMRNQKTVAKSILFKEQQSYKPNFLRFNS